MKTINIADMNTETNTMHGEIMSDKDDSMSVTPVDETLPDDELEEATGGASAVPDDHWNTSGATTK